MCLAHATFLNITIHSFIILHRFSEITKSLLLRCRSLSLWLSYGWCLNLNHALTIKPLALMMSTCISGACTRFSTVGAILLQYNMMTNKGFSICSGPTIYRHFHFPSQNIQQIKMIFPLVYFCYLMCILHLAIGGVGLRRACVRGWGMAVDGLIDWAWTRKSLIVRPGAAI